MQYSAMEQTRSYLMWSRRKIVGTVVPPLFNSPSSTPAAGAAGSAVAYHESWEEQAFAEDSSGLSGGCVWPPRSYSCSFCRREFRSAQALGGHMNVHRRDRASLKQSSSSSPTGEENLNKYPPQISTTPAECYNPNPNPNPNSGVDQYTLLSPSYSSSFPIARLFTDPVPVRLLGVPDLKLGMDNWKSKEEGSTTLGKRGRRVIDDDDNDDVVIGEKRRRFDPVFPFVKPPPVASEVLKLGSTSPDDVEELDLELRLGDPPKVK